jgi:hypothetical protein
MTLKKPWWKGEETHNNKQDKTGNTTRRDEIGLPSNTRATATWEEDTTQTSNE